jgi:hypothetical protein
MKALGLLVNLVGVDQDLADFRLEVIADGTDDQAAFQIDQERAALLLGSTFDGTPQLQQVVQVPLQFFGLATDGRRAGDQAHVTGDFELIHGVAQLGALIAIDAPRNTTAARIVRHQDEVTAGQ